MTHAEIYEAIESAGLPVAYYAFPEGAVPALPFIVYYYPNSNNFGADDAVYQKIEALNVELYTKVKDFALEETVEGALASLGYWEKSETYLTSEEMYEVLYQTEVMING